LLVLAFSIAAACEKRPLGQPDAATGGEGAAGASGPAGAVGATGPAGAAGAAGAPGGGGGGGPVGGAFGGSGDGTCAAGVGGRGGSLGAACADGIDNDGDGKIDYDDPECVGGHDDDEATFAWGIPGDNTDACKTDCFFDSNSGSGDDNCAWRFKCDPLSTALSCPYDAAYAAAHPEECSLSSSQTQVCVDRCQKLVPNGCDCFGCCAIPGLPGPIRLAYSCTAADFGDPRRCPPCTQVTQCLNPCERCEICIGKPGLPDDCATPDGGAPYACPGGAIACGTHGVAPECCLAATSCVTGCCLRLDPLP
jgi:hypothetical protein